MNLGIFRVSLGTVNEEPGLLRSITMCNKSATADSDIPDLPPRPSGTKLENVPGLRSDILHSSRMDIDNGMVLLRRNDFDFIPLKILELNK